MDREQIDKAADKVSLGVLVLVGLMAVVAVVCMAVHMRGVCERADRSLDTSRGEIQGAAVESSCADMEVGR